MVVLQVLLLAANLYFTFKPNNRFWVINALAAGMGIGQLMALVLT